eukprot:COSAG01_NODE_367_length_18064_cov_23.990315_5_plen_101_part_00
MVGGKENVSKTTTADGAQNALLRRRLMLRDGAEPGRISISPMWSDGWLARASVSLTSARRSLAAAISLSDGAGVAATCASKTASDTKPPTSPTADVAGWS